MKINTGFLLRKVAGENVILFTDPGMKNKLITLNSTGVFLVEKMSEPCTEEELVTALLSEYNVDEETARHDVHEFTGVLRGAGVID